MDCEGAGVAEMLTSPYFVTLILTENFWKLRDGIRVSCVCFRSIDIEKNVSNVIR